MAAASVIVDMTLSVLTQVVFTLTGLLALAFLTDRGIDWKTVFVGCIVACIAVGGFFAVQQLGMFRIIGAIAAHVMRAEQWNGLADRGAAFDAEVRAISGRRSRIALGCFWTMLCWMGQAGEVWVAMWVLGIHGTYVHAYVLEAASQGIRSVLFLIPGAIGVQEGGYVVVGGMLGIPAEAALALALVRRARELLFGVPGIIAWQWADSHGLWRRKGSSTAMSSRPPALQNQ
jgi:putative membrane protein